MHSLPDEIEEDAERLAMDYPKGATLIDLAGYYGVPLPEVERAISVLRREGIPLPFLKGDAPPAPVKATVAPAIKPAAWAPNGRAKTRVSAHPNKKERTLPEQMADQVRHRIGELVHPYPFGATAAQFADHFNLTMNHAYAVVSELEAECEIVRLDGYDYPKTKLIFVRGMVQPPPPLTDIQEKVYTEALKRSSNGHLVFNFTDVARVTGVSQGSVQQIAWTLERKGYLRRISPYAQHGGGRDGEGKLKGAPSPEYYIYEPTPTVPAFPRKEDMKGVSEPPPVAKIADEATVKRAVARRAELVREIARIDDFLATYGEMYG